MSDHPEDVIGRTIIKMKALAQLFFICSTSDEIETGINKHDFDGFQLLLYDFIDKIEKAFEEIRQSQKEAKNGGVS